MQADVCDVIISGVAQKEGRVVTQPQIGNATGSQKLDPPVIKGQTVAQFYNKYDNRFNWPRYYSGDAAS